MAALRVLMLVNNDIRHDTRVLKSALAVADGGAAVTIIGYASNGYPEHVAFGDVEIHRVPLAWRYQRRHERRRAAFLESTLVPHMPGQERNLLVRRSRLRAAEAAELGGRGRAVRAAIDGAQTRVRTRLGRLTERLTTGEQQFRARMLDWHDEQTRLASWRRDMPAIDDYETAYSSLINTLEWDVIHAHDYHHMGTAARAVARRRAEGRDAWWIYDAHEYVPGLSLSPPRTPRSRAACVALEREHIGLADAVITVTGPLADELQRSHRLPVRPGVVHNAPVLDGDPGIRAGLDIRADCGVAPGEPLLVYSGGVAVPRGVQTAISALPLLPDVHLAVVCVPNARTTRVLKLRTLATELGVADRVHLLDPVAPDDVSAYVASADVGVIPLVHFGSHEFALANKLFEYLHAGLPLLVSDCRAQAEFVRHNAVGEVHRAEDVADFARQARAVLERAPELRRHIAADPQMLAPYDWARQAQTLRSVYRGIVGEDRLPEPVRQTDLSEVHERPLWRDDRPLVVGFGSTNMGGQCWRWAKALERHLPGTATYVFETDEGGPLTYPADEIVPFSVYRTNQRWAASMLDRIHETWTHALIEAGRPFLGHRYGRDFSRDADALRAVGIRVGLVLDATSFRDPAAHVHRTPFSPYTDTLEPVTAQVQARRNGLLPKVQAFIDADHGPVFVRTPDMLEDVPGSIWLPHAVDPTLWEIAPTTFDREVPVVLHVPTRPGQQGTYAADAVGRLLESQGLIRYRRFENVSPKAMRGLVEDADIVLDQFALGTHGLMSVEAMAAGRIAVAHVTPQTRTLLPGCPVVEADPDNLEAVLRDLLADREEGRRVARASQAYAREVHDGRRSAAVLAEHLLRRPAGEIDAIA